jgi:pyrroloquinoline quinone biosynthesis protein B
MPATVHVLGTAQDGGFPHAGCACPSCAAARADEALRRRVACIGLVGTSGRCLLVDATPDLAVQIDALAEATGRPGPGLDALVLTHAHIGHYLGLALLGREAMSVRRLPVHCTRSMRRFLEGNRPWSHLVERDEIVLATIEPGTPLTFDGIEVRAFLSPHRSEDTDTIGLEVQGPERTLLYVSDADVFPPELATRIREADVALIDGTFYEREELRHREILEVRHPFVAESVERFADARGEVVFIHLNHTNALLSADPPTLPSGFSVAREGQVFEI